MISSNASRFGITLSKALSFSEQEQLGYFSNKARKVSLKSVAPVAHRIWPEQIVAELYRCILAGKLLHFECDPNLLLD